MKRRFRELASHIKPGLTPVLISFSLGMLLYFTAFENLLHLPVRSFPDRSIGVAAFAGIDANLRTLYYCLSIFVVIVLIGGLFLVLSRIDAVIKQKIAPLMVRPEQSLQFSLSLFSMFLVLYALYKGESGIFNIAWLVYLLIGLVYFYIFLKIATSQKHLPVYQYYRDYSLFAFSLVFSFTLLFAGWAFLGIPLAFSGGFILVFFAFNFIFLTVYPFLIQRLGINHSRVKTPNLVATIPLALIPAFIPLSNELHYALSGSFNMIAPENFARVIAGILFLSGILLYLVFLFKRMAVQTSTVIGGIIFPAIIIGFFLFGAIDGLIRFQDFDLFHNGERMIVTHQMFSFGSIPFIDLIPTHGVMDFLGQSMYTLVNGNSGPEMFLWRWIPVVAGYLFLYFMLTRLASPVFAFLFLLITPELSLIHINYRYVIAIMLVLFWVSKRPDLKRYMVLWFSLVLLYFWRYDFGVIASIATLCIIPGLYYLKTSAEVSFHTLITAFKPALGAMAIVFPAVLIVYSLLLLVNGYNPIGVVEQFYYYFKIQVPTQTTVIVYQDHSVLFLLEYIVTPMISVAYILYYLYAVLFKEERFRILQLVLVWLAIFGVVISMRMIQRHTLMEGFNPVFSIFLLCAAPFYFHKLNKWVSHTLFLLIFLIYGMLISNPQERVFVKTDVHNLVPEGTLYNFFSLPGKASRVEIGDSTQFKKFNVFCDIYLTKDQTFFDFTNAPLLYVFTNRLFPAHLIPNLYQAADPIQDYVIKRIDPYRKSGLMPLVLFKQNTVWDSIDGVPQPIRSYRIAEYIYKNYIPFAKVDNYEIWQEKKSNLTLGESTRISPGFIKSPDNRLSGVEVSQFSDDSIAMRTFGADPYISNVLDLGNGIVIDSAQSYMLSISFTSGIPGKLQVFYSMNGSPYSEKMSKYVHVSGESGIQERSLAIPHLSGGDVLTGLRFDPPTGTTFCLYRPGITEGNFFPVERTDPQHFNLGKLPYVWANYDEKHASTRTEILEDYLISDSLVEAGENRSISLKLTIDKSQGNYLHLFINAKEKGQVLITYNNLQPSSIKFDLEPTGSTEQYLVRVSTQWAWMNDNVDVLNIRSSVPVTFSRMLIRKGD